MISANTTTTLRHSLNTANEDDVHVRLRDIGKQFALGTWVLESVDLDVRRGEVFGLLGPSGCGKTTLLNIISGFVDPTTGTIEVGGQIYNDVRPSARRSAMVFQSYALFPHLTALENVAFGLRVRNKPKADAHARAAELLEFVDLGEAAAKYPRQLSGGQQQRVAVARALAVEPELLLLDEPLSNLDAKLRRQMRDELRGLLDRAAITTVLVTHDQDEAFAMCDTVAVMFGGHVDAVGQPRDLYMTPPTLRSASFIGESNMIPAVLNTRGSDGIEVVTEALPIGGRKIRPRFIGDNAPDAGVLLIRPEAVRILERSDALAHFEAKVEDVLYLGNQAEVSLRVGDLRFVATTLLGSGRIPAVGETVGVTWDDQSFLYLGED